MNTTREIMLLGAALCTVALAVPVGDIWQGTSRVSPATVGFLVHTSANAGSKARVGSGPDISADPGPMPLAALAGRNLATARTQATSTERTVLPTAGLGFLCACLNPEAKPRNRRD